MHLPTNHLAGRAEISWYVALLVPIVAPAEDRSILVDGTGVGETCVHPLGRVTRGADATGEGRLVEGVFTPAGDRTIRAQGDGVVVKRTHLGRTVLAGGEAAGDFALVVGIAAPAGDGTVLEDTDQVSVAPVDQLHGVPER